MDSVIRCPICSGKIYYDGNTWHDDDLEYEMWKCENCGATAIGKFKIMSREQTDVKDKNDNDKPNKKTESDSTFWVS